MKSMKMKAIRLCLIVGLMTLNCGYGKKPDCCKYILQYSKTCVKRPLKKDKTKTLMTDGSLIKVEIIAECSPWSILQYL